MPVLPSHKTLCHFLGIVLSLGMILPVLNSQQLPLFTNYSENQGLINPAAVSPNYLLKEYNVNLSAVHRSQWVGIPNYPRTSAVSGEYVMETENAFNMILGGSIIQDRVGPISLTGIYARIAGIRTGHYSNKSGFSAGITAGLLQYRVEELTQYAIHKNDPNLFVNETQFFPDIGVGAALFHQFEDGWAEGDNIYIGLSIPQVFGLNVNFRGPDGNFDIQRTQHYYGAVSYYKFIHEESYIELAGWVRYVRNAPASYDGNLRYKISESMWIGFGASSSGVGHIEAGIILAENIGLQDRSLKIGYAFDPAFTTFNVRFANTHEINVIYSFATY